MTDDDAFWSIIPLNGFSNDKILERRQGRTAALGWDQFPCRSLRGSCVKRMAVKFEWIHRKSL
ncbi:MAG TPA: hypothetical protein DCE44_06935 [Verrucomicrobiales bacterium]|nr:hypothetical protein [Verrucomicrobiales bacterium]